MREKHDECEWKWIKIKMKMYIINKYFIRKIFFQFQWNLTYWPFIIINDQSIINKMYIKFVQIAQISILIIQHFFKIKIVTKCQEYETIFII